MRPLTLYAIIALSSAALAGEGDGRGNLAVPDGAKLTLQLDKSEYFLGENILLHYVLENEGEKPFSFNFGGDNHASRSMRFKVTAVDAAGKEAADPDPNGMCFGGMGGTPTLKPGEKWIESLPLQRYRRFENAGVYTVRVTHDLGWKKSAGKTAPSAEIAIIVRMPDAQQARKVVEEMEHLTGRNGTYGKKCEPYADFAALGYPVYLPILAEKARLGSQLALEGIARIATPEATATLIDLLDPKLSVEEAQRAERFIAQLDAKEFDAREKAQAGLTALGSKVHPLLEERLAVLSKTPNSSAEMTNRLRACIQSMRGSVAFSADAARALTERLPMQETPDTDARRCALGNGTQQRREFSLKAWRAAFAPRVRAIAKRLIAAVPTPLPEEIAWRHGDSWQAEYGSEMIEAAGEKEDLTVLMAALDSLLENHKEARVGKDLLPQPPGAYYHLFAAVKQLSGGKAPAKARTAGEIAVCLALDLPADEIKPAGWSVALEKWLGSDIPYIREMAVTRMSAPLPQTCLNKLPALLMDADLGVRIAACQAVGTHKVLPLRDAILKILATTTEEWLIRAADNTAQLLDARTECVKIWVGRLDEDGMGAKALYTLLEVAHISHSGYGGGKFDAETARSIKTAWRGFVAAHENEIRAGHEFQPGGPALNEQMFPPDFVLFTKDNTRWPKR